MVFSWSVSSFEPKFWSGVRPVLMSLTSSDIPVWFGIWISPCEHSRVATVENEYLLALRFGGFAICFTLFLAICLYIIFVSQIPKCHEVVGMPSIYSARQVMR